MRMNQQLIKTCKYYKEPAKFALFCLKNCSKSLLLLEITTTLIKIEKLYFFERTLQVKVTKQRVTGQTRRLGLMPPS